MTESDLPAFPQLSAEDRAALTELAQQQPPGTLRLRGRIVLACAEGLTNTEAAQRLRVSPATVAKWRERYLRRGVAGLRDAPRSGRPRSANRQEAEARVAAVLEQARGGAPVPSTRSLSDTLGLSQSTVARIWREQQTGLPDPPGPRAGGPRREAAGGGGGPVPGRTRMPRQLLSDHVYTLLRDWIVSGQLAPGQRLVESEIARGFGTSQAPPREAIKRLAYEGLVITQPHRGTYVARVSERQAQDVRDIRVMFEEYAARRVTGRLDAEHTRLLTEDVAQLRRAAAKDDIGAFRDADMSFHRHVCEAARNAALIRLWRLIESSLWDLHVLGDPRYAGGWGAMAEHHAELLDVLRSGDPDVAGPMFADHAAGEAARYLPDRSGPLPGPGGDAAGTTP
ncbi:MULTISPECIES: GntR family transcriptional regulator [Streptomyces]|uniref:GntR family transcriptional regulator n=1 Tax=Streptomyces TaxID=1883 RepID=UPI0018853759|nr:MULTISPECIES: GntR family transcriptional regulator [Streptomyces]MBF8173176.1 GntR family transcriptional regulator [Streptomyces olivaceus]MBZ6134967.1 GntR family transcriptional regulator [Streptomyces olivaceus]MBZ6259527.1 GntR family transcriptional regulator [Streptomyces olivaceus]WFB82334.1 GntR family transcriptional regulator [Streptomyces olivaceus]WGK44670.1 GntR family transcriptional regulator [Streptomyces sp. B146]